MYKLTKLARHFLLGKKIANIKLCCQSKVDSTNMKKALPVKIKSDIKDRSSNVQRVTNNFVVFCILYSPVQCSNYF